MNTGMALVIMGEILLTLFLVYGFMHEEKFIELEDRIILEIKQKRAAKKKAKRAQYIKKLNEKVCYTPEIPSKKAANPNRVA